LSVGVGIMVGEGQRPAGEVLADKTLSVQFGTNETPSTMAEGAWSRGMHYGRQRVEWALAVARRVTWGSDLRCKLIGHMNNNRGITTTILLSCMGGVAV
jgi:hypothetical protein